MVGQQCLVLWQQWDPMPPLGKLFPECGDVVGLINVNKWVHILGSIYD